MIILLLIVGMLLCIYMKIDNIKPIYDEEYVIKRIDDKFGKLKENIHNELILCTNKIKTYNKENLKEARDINFLNSQSITNMTNHFTDTDVDSGSKNKNKIKYLSDNLYMSY